MRTEQLRLVDNMRVLLTATLLLTVIGCDCDKNPDAEECTAEQTEEDTTQETKVQIVTVAATPTESKPAVVKVKKEKVIFDETSAISSAVAVEENNEETITEVAKEDAVEVVTVSNEEVIEEVVKEEEEVIEEEVVVEVAPLHPNDDFSEENLNTDRWTA